MTDTRPDLAAIKARAEAATPGPWVLDSHAHPLAGCRCLSCYQVSTVWQPGGLFCDDIPCSERSADDQGDRCDQFGYTYEDAAHIAGMDPPTTLALVAEVERLTEHVAAVDGMLAAAIDLAERSDAPDRVPTRVVRTIEQLNRSALPATHDVDELLGEVYTPGGVEIWWRSRNRNIGAVPAVLWSRNAGTDRARVQAEAERLAGGAS